MKGLTLLLLPSLCCPSHYSYPLPSLTGRNAVGLHRRWNFLLINIMRDALSRAPFRFWIKPELDGIVCVDSIVATLMLTRSWQPWAGGFMRGCHWDEALLIYDVRIVRYLASSDRWERLLAPSLRLPGEIVVERFSCSKIADKAAWSKRASSTRADMALVHQENTSLVLALRAAYMKQHASRCYQRLGEAQHGGALFLSTHGRYLPALLRSAARGHGNDSPPQQPWAFSTHTSGQPFLYLHSGKPSGVARQWSMLNKTLARGRALERTLPVGGSGCSGYSKSYYDCAVQKLSCRHSWFIHKIKEQPIIRELWQAQLDEQPYYDQAEAARNQLRSLKLLNATKHMLSRDSACDARIPASVVGPRASIKAVGLRT